MATATKTWTFTSSTTGWSFTPNLSETGTTSGTNGLVTSISGKNLSSGEIGSSFGWLMTDTYANIWGIPSNATVSQIGGGGSDAVRWLCTAFTTGGSSHTAAAVNEASWAYSAGTSFTTTTSASNAALTAQTGLSRSASSNLTLRIQNNISTGNSNSAVMTVGVISLILTITYTVPVVASLVASTPQRALAHRHNTMDRWN